MRLSLLFVTQIYFLPMTTVCGTGGDIRFCGQKQTLIIYVLCAKYHPKIILHK